VDDALIAAAAGAEGATLVVAGYGFRDTGVDIVPGRVVSADTDSTLPATPTPLGTLPAAGPLDVKFGGDGRLYVAQFPEGTFTSGGVYVLEGGTLQPVIPSLAPLGMAFAPASFPGTAGGSSGDLFVTNFGSQTIPRFTHQGGSFTPGTGFNLPTIEDNGLNQFAPRPGLMAFGPDNRLFVAASGRVGSQFDGIYVFDGVNDPTLLTGFNGDGSPANLPFAPTGMAFDAAGNLFVGSADSGGQVFVMDADTGTLLNGGSPLITGVGANGVSALAFGPDGLLYVGDLGGSRVLRYAIDFSGGVYTAGTAETVVDGAAHGLVGVTGLAFHPIPEPSALLLLAAGSVAGIALLRRRIA
jgi:sugar lactone lactonase YvrE